MNNLLFIIGSRPVTYNLIERVKLGVESMCHQPRDFGQRYFDELSQGYSLHV